MSCTAKISGRLSAIMDGFDLLAFGIAIFDSTNPLVKFNEKLHSSTLYNALQFSANAVAAFSGGALIRMKQGPPVCFVAGTMILTAAGLVAIENIKAGDNLSPILDLYNGEIISYNLSLRLTFHQIINMLDKAFAKITNSIELMLHSDQSWQYQMKHYQYRLKEKGIIQSMSRKANCLDNSLMENFFGLLKTEMFYKHEFKSVEHLMSEIEK